MMNGLIESNKAVEKVENVSVSIGAETFPAYFCVFNVDNKSVEYLDRGCTVCKENHLQPTERFVRI